MKFTSFVSAIALALFAGSGWTAANVVSNPGFETPNSTYTPPNYPVTQSGLAGGNPASAANWTLWNNDPALLSNELLPSTDPFVAGGSYMTHVTSSGTNNGLFQFFSLTSPATAEVSVNVISGSMFFGMFQDGSIPRGSVTTAAPGWQRLAIPLSAGAVNEVVLYTGPGGGEFYADNVFVSTAPLLGPIAAIPEPSSYALMLAGLGFVAFAAKRRKKPAAP